MRVVGDDGDERHGVVESRWTRRAGCASLVRPARGRPSTVEIEVTPEHDGAAASRDRARADPVDAFSDLLTAPPTAPTCRRWRHERRASAPPSPRCPTPPRRMLVAAGRRARQRDRQRAGAASCRSPARPWPSTWRVLHAAGLVEPSRREGRETRYAVTPEPLEQAVAWIVQAGGEWDDRLARLGTLRGRRSRRVAPRHRYPARTMSAIRQAEPVLSATEASQAGLDRERLLRLYRDMLATRAIEERGNLLFKAGQLPGSYYTGRGNEAASVGVASAMGERRRGLAAAPQHGRARRPRRRPGRDLLPVHGPLRRRHRRPRLEPAHQRLLARRGPAGRRQPPAGHDPRHHRHGAGLPAAARAAGGGRLVRRRRRRARRHARGR